ncbi:MAG: biotin/lipoyl-containing protein [Polyangiales bacterium]
MKYRVTIDGQEREIDVQVTSGGRVSVALDGEPVDADVEQVPGGVSVRLGGKVYDVTVGGRAEEMTVTAGRHRTVASVESERLRARKKARGGGSKADKEIRAPMPGRIVKVLVSPGDEVDAGQPVVVIEAMKMENELRATGAAKVASVEVTEGQNVEGNVLLVTFV